MTDTAQWVTLLTVVAGFVYQAYRETRQRRWDLEDRKVLAEKVEATAEGVETRVLKQAAEIKAELKENTDISRRAFHEANSVNLKIEKLGLEHNALQREQNDK